MNSYSYCDRMHALDSLPPSCFAFAVLSWQTKFPFDITFYRSSHATAFHFPLLCRTICAYDFACSLSSPSAVPRATIRLLLFSAFVLLPVAFLSKFFSLALLFLFKVRICTHHINDNKDKSGIKNESTLKIEWIIGVYIRGHCCYFPTFLWGNTTKTTRNCAERTEKLAQSQRKSERQHGLGWPKSSDDFRLLISAPCNCCSLIDDSIQSHLNVMINSLLADNNEIPFSHQTVGFSFSLALSFWRSDKVSSEKNRICNAVDRFYILLWSIFAGFSCAISNERGETKNQKRTKNRASNK